MSRRINRIAIFIDHDNFVSNFKKKIKRKKLEDYDWERLNPNLIKAYKRIFPFKEEIDHIGTWICLPKEEYPKTDGAMTFLESIRRVDCLQKFIVKYGYWKKDNKGRQEKMVDTEIVCQMLMGAFRDEYDTCFILSDDADYVPAVHRIQDIFGKRVIQVGFSPKSRLRAACYGHLPLEDADADLNIARKHVVKS